MRSLFLCIPLLSTWPLTLSAQSREEELERKVGELEQRLEAMERQLGALWSAINRAISENNFPTRTSRLCDYCSYRDICPAWAGEAS